MEQSAWHGITDTPTCHLDWGRSGVARAAARGDVLVIVDVLRFSTAAIVAVQCGALIYPCVLPDEGEALARRVGAQVADYRGTPHAGRPYSLSPSSFADVQAGTRIVVSSPNGAACCALGRGAPYLFVGALINAAATGAAVTAVLGPTNPCVTVVACGERWASPSEDGALRVAVEDYLGAGAILSALPCDKSPEAWLCAAAFDRARDRVRDLLWDCASGRELRAKGYGPDVEFAARLDHYEAVPVGHDEYLERFHAQAAAMRRHDDPAR